jgi:predicted dithiol-disulfide oxidoreductase (DUF899 family)
MKQTQQKFFHIIDQRGQIDKQGMVLSRSLDRVTVEFFSWLDGTPNGRQTFDQVATETWRFYKSDTDWKHAGDKVFA